MKYENFEQAKFVASKIKENEDLLSDLRAAEEVSFQLPSGYHTKTIQCGLKCEPDYALDNEAKRFKEAIIKIVEANIASLHDELAPL